MYASLCNLRNTVYELGHNLICMVCMYVSKYDIYSNIRR